MAKYYQARSINAVQSVTPYETTDVCCWQCGEKGHYKGECPHNVHIKWPRPGKFI